MLCYMTGMTPPTSTNDKQGTVIDGTARSAEWRKKQRAAQTPHAPTSPAASDGVPAADFDPAAAKDFVSSVMIPANQIAGETRTKRREPEPPDPYIDTLLNGSGERQPPQELEEDARASSPHSDEPHRSAAEETSPGPPAPAGASASLDMETAEGGSVERARRGRALGLRLGRAHGNRPRRRQPADRRSLRARVHPTRVRVLAVTVVLVLSVAAIAIAAGGSPAH